MKRLIAFLAAAGLCALPMVVSAGDYHTGGLLICSDCHTAHYSQQHGYTDSTGFTALGPDGPYPRLLRNDPNELCLTCHNNQTFAPDVFGENGGEARVRRAGGLNAAPGHLANDAGYEDIDGHTLWSTATAPGGAFADTTEGLECVDCHGAHGSPTQYRNMRSSTRSTSIWYQKYVTYSIASYDTLSDVYEPSAADYNDADIQYMEPHTNASAYAAWCKTCHTDFHGSSTDANMNDGSDWVRHPTADVNLGSSLMTQYGTHTNKVKVMDSSHLWTAASTTLTPSCMTCHKSHGNKNAFGLVFMGGTGTVTEEGDGGQLYRSLCKQCHTQGGN